MESNSAAFTYDPNGLKPREKKYNWHEEFKRWKLERSRASGKNARRLLMTKTRKNKVNFYSKLASERIVSYYSQYDVYRFTGSSYNRQLKILYNERDLAERIEKAEAAGVSLDVVLSDREQSKVNGVCGDEKSVSDVTRRVVGTDGKKRRVHVLSPRSKGKIRAKITEFFAWCKRAKKQCTFLTLTFISDVADRVAMRILNKFLTSMRQEVGAGFQYIRVAERQKNGNIHFHLILDRAINIIRFNSLWVLTQYNEGLLAMSRQLDLFISKEEIVARHEKLMSLYQDYKRAREIRDSKSMQAITEKLKEISIGKLLNPVDIKKVSSAGALAGYLTKYVTKNDAEFGCLAWSCSRGVSQMFTAAMVPYKVWSESLSETNSYVTSDGELVQPTPYQDPKGMSVTIKIYNRKYFDQYLAEMRVVNHWILTGEIGLPGVPRYTIDEYMYLVHNFN